MRETRGWVRMARQIRIEYAGVTYHMMARETTVRRSQEMVSVEFLGSSVEVRTAGGLEILDAVGVAVIPVFP